jgi:HD superfamily phosphohydrolase
MLRRAAERLLDAPDVSASDLRRMDDHDLVSALRTSPKTSGYAERLDTRRLFKRAVWAEYGDVPASLLDASHAELREHERAIADCADVDPDNVVIDVPSRPSMTESTSRVVVNGDIRELGKASPLVSALRTAQKQQWRFGVYCPRAETERVGRAAVETLGLDVDGALVSDVRAGLNATLDEFR